MPPSWLEFAGRLHPLILHLPIGLWVGVMFLEFGAALFRRTPSRGAIVALACLAALSGLAAAGSGWLLGEEGEFSPVRQDPHRWAGLAMAGLGVVAAMTSAAARRTAFRCVLVMTAVAMTIAGHLGGSLTHGEAYLTGSGGRQARPSATDPGNTVVVPVPAADSHYATQIAPLLQRLCVPCHNEEKHKNDLRLDSPETIQAGGENGVVLIPGSPEKSPIYSQLLLPADDEKHMPPPKKEQPTPAEIEVLRVWIQAGAPFTGPLPTRG
jgi:hypothetical protein